MSAAAAPCVLYGGLAHWTNVFQCHNGSCIKTHKQRSQETSHMFAECKTYMIFHIRIGGPAFAVSHLPVPHFQRPQSCLIISRHWRYSVKDFRDKYRSNCLKDLYVLILRGDGIFCLKFRRKKPRRAFTGAALSFWTQTITLYHTNITV